MYFYISKIAWFFLHPSSLILIILAAGAIQLSRRKPRGGTALVVLGTALYAVFGLTPAANLMLLPLETRFSRPVLPADFEPYGIIVLGGALDSTPESESRPASALNEAGERMTEAVSLMLRFPKARVVFTGGNAALVPGAGTEADAAGRFVTRMGMDAGQTRITYEKRSRNTAENAGFTRDLVQPRPEQQWLLVTSAFHMPRSMDLFRRAEFNVLPWPADYRTRRPVYMQGFNNPADGLRRTDLAAKEWLSLMAHWLSGKTGSLLPAP